MSKKKSEHFSSAELAKQTKLLMVAFRKQLKDNLNKSKKLNKISFTVPNSKVRPQISFEG